MREYEIDRKDKTVQRILKHGCLTCRGTFQTEGEIIASVERLGGALNSETFHVPPQAPQNVWDSTFVNSSKIKSKAAGAPQIIGWENVIDSGGA